MPTTCNWLVLVPTAMERAYIATDQLPRAQVEICGFGPVIAAARTASLIERLSPDRVLLVGIAGRLASDLQLGNAYTFRRVICHGVGIGSGRGFRSAEEIGWSPWNDTELKIGTELPLDPETCQHLLQCDLLITACAASANPTDAMNVKHTYPQASAEDMEGYSVAAAATLSGLPITIVRGISNDAGDRNHETWQIEKAMQSVNQMVMEIVGAKP